jgi:hypothetical protein
MFQLISIKKISAGNLFGARTWQVVEGHEPDQVDQSSEDQADQEARTGIRKAITILSIFFKSSSLQTLGRSRF